MDSRISSGLRCHILPVCEHMDGLKGKDLAAIWNGDNFFLLFQINKAVLHKQDIVMVGFWVEKLKMAISNQIQNFV